MPGPEKYETILKLDNVVGLNIATRPDSISDECLDYLEELAKKTYLTIELGLQTIHESTSKFINRCHTLDCFSDMVKKLPETEQMCYNYYRSKKVKRGK